MVTKEKLLELALDKAQKSENQSHSPSAIVHAILYVGKQVEEAADKINDAIRWAGGER